MKYGLLLAGTSAITAPWFPLREGNENTQAADFISFYRAVSFYGKQSKHHKTMASIATLTLGSSADIPPRISLCFDNVTFLFVQKKASISFTPNYFS